MRVLLTGGTGFIGLRLAARLVEAGHAVRAVTRRSSRTDGLEAAGAELAPLGLEDPAALAPALEGVDAIVHAAGGGVMRRPQDLLRSNVDTTRSLVAAAASSQPRFLLLSSLAAHGPAGPEAPATEDDPVRPRSAYGRAKRDAEELVRASGLDALILRPPAVYGPGDTRMRPLFIGAQRGLLPRVGRGWTSLVHVDDLVEVTLLALERGTFDGRAYYVDDGAPLPQVDLLREIGRAVGREPILVPVPAPVLRALGALSEARARVFGPATAFTRDKVRDLLAPGWVCDSARIRAELGWAPCVPRPQGLAETAERYRQEGWL